MALYANDGSERHSTEHFGVEPRLAPVFIAAPRVTVERNLDRSGRILHGGKEYAA